jgi:hypothetical protein
MAYLRHIINVVGVAMDPTKITVVEEWPRPWTLHALWGFLGLTGYYRKFIVGYNEIAAPLMALMKEAFRWSKTRRGCLRTTQASSHDRAPASDAELLQALHHGL